MTDDQQARLEQAATQYAIHTPVEQICAACGEDTAWPTDKRVFLAGAAWMKADEAKLVVLLVEALREIEQQELVSINCPNGLIGCAVNHRKRTSAGKIAFEALRAYERGDT